MRWQVEGRDFLACHGWWLGSIAGAIALLIVLYGFVRPQRFGAEEAVTIAVQEAGLKRAVARRLVELPGWPARLVPLGPHRAAPGRHGHPAQPRRGGHAARATR